VLDLFVCLFVCFISCIILHFALHVHVYQNQLLHWRWHHFLTSQFYIKFAWHTFSFVHSGIVLTSNYNWLSPIAEDAEIVRIQCPNMVCWEWFTCGKMVCSLDVWFSGNGSHSAHNVLICMVLRKRFS
jgi:hypothetical protein